MAQFEVRTKVYYGIGERDRLLQYLSEHGFTRCGVVIDNALLSHEVFKDLIEKMKKGLKYFKMLSYDYNGEPTYGYLDTVKSFFKQGEMECLIGIGGGSAIDVTKALAVLINNPVKKSVELRGFPQIANLTVPVVAVPTIAGTGTEVTFNAVFTDESEIRKMGINTKYNFPVFALVDPELALSAPLKQSLSSALDCLVHTVESFMSIKATFVTRPLSIEAFSYVFRGLQALMKDPKSIGARENLAKASYLAGIALINSSSGPGGALSYPLGTFFKVPHGFAGAFFLRHVLMYNVSRGYNDFYILYEKVNGRDLISREEKAKRIVNEIIETIEKAGVPERLSGFGVKKENIADFFNQATNHMWGAFGVNPVEMSKEDLSKFLAGAL